MTGLLAVLIAATPSGAAEVSVGLGLGASFDLPDRSSSDHTRFGPGPSLRIPVAVELGEGARVRLTLRADLATGRDRVLWSEWIDGEEVRFYDDDHWAMFASGGATVGFDAVVPLEGSVRPYLGAEVGVAWVGTYHSLGTRASSVFDPDRNDLDDPRNVDPYTSQVVPLAELHVGSRFDVADALSLYLEIGYAVAQVPEATLRKSAEAASAVRAAYGWNALGATAGVAFRF